MANDLPAPPPPITKARRILPDLPPPPPPLESIAVPPEVQRGAGIILSGVETEAAPRTEPFTLEEITRQQPIQIPPGAQVFDTTGMDTRSKIQRELSALPQAPSVTDRAAFREKYGEVDPATVSELYRFMPFTASMEGMLGGAEKIRTSGGNVGQIALGATQIGMGAMTGLMPEPAGISALLGAGQSALEAGAPKVAEKTRYITNPVSSILKPTTEDGKAWSEVADNLVLIGGGLLLHAGTDAVRNIARNQFATEIKSQMTPSDMRSLFARVKAGVGTPQEVELTKVVAKMYEAGPEAQKGITGIEVVRGREYSPGTPKWIKKVLGDFPPNQLYPRFRFTGNPAQDASPSAAEAAPKTGPAPQGTADAATGQRILPEGQHLTREQRRRALMEGLTGPKLTPDDYTRMRDELQAGGYDSLKIVRLTEDELERAYTGDYEVLKKITVDPHRKVVRPVADDIDVNNIPRQFLEQNLERSGENINALRKLSQEDLYKRYKEKGLDKVGTYISEMDKAHLDELVKLQLVSPEERDAALKVRGPINEQIVRDIQKQKQTEGDIPTTAPVGGVEVRPKQYPDTPEGADQWLKDVTGQVESLREQHGRILLGANIYEQFLNAVKSGRITADQFKEFQKKGTVISDEDYQKALDVRKQIEQIKQTPLGTETQRPATPDERAITANFPHNAPLNISNAQKLVGLDIFNRAAELYVKSKGLTSADVNQAERVGAAIHSFAMQVLAKDQRADAFLQQARLTPTEESGTLEGEEPQYGDPLTGSTQSEPTPGPDLETTPGVSQGEPSPIPPSDVPGGQPPQLPGPEDTGGGGLPGETPTPPEGPPAGTPQQPRQPGGGISGGGGGPRPGPPVPGPAAPGEPVGGAGRPESGPAPKLVPVKPEDFNHRILPGHVITPTGEIGKIKANLHAITLLKTLEAEGRNPSPDEKEILARYTGWGGLPNVFNESLAEYREYEGVKPRYTSEETWNQFLNWNKKFGPYYDQIKALLSEKEWEDAMNSTINAHYTSRDVIEHGLWNIVKQIGGATGKALEPAGGVGHIIGLTPEALVHALKWTVVELDSLSGRLLQKLYPEARVHVTGFQTAPTPNNFYNLVITNVPFGKTGPFDERYAKEGFSLHNYFLARGIDVLKPGGFQVAITSISTMDNESSRKARKWISDRADLVAAIRLPDTAFKENAGTEVVTDILVFRKKDGNPFTMAEPFTEVTPIGVGDEEYPLNEYFVKHPDMILGDLSFSGTMYREGMITVTPFTDRGTLAEQLDQAVQKVPKNINNLVATEVGDDENIVAAPTEMKQGAFVEEKGKIFQNTNGVLTEVVPATPEEGRLIRSFIGVRDTLKTLLEKQIDPKATDVELNNLRRALNQVYDAHVKGNRFFLQLSNSILTEDPEFPLVASLEDLVVTQKEVLVKSGPEKGQKRTVNVREYRKAPIFSQRTMFPHIEPATAGTIDDAIHLSINYRNRIDPEYMAKLVNIPADEIRQQLIDEGKAFENPGTGLLESPDEYLSGNVRQKLHEAQLAQRDNPVYERNVNALTPVIPVDILFHEIGFRLGSAWVPTQYIQEFVRRVLRVDSRVYFVPEINRWKIQVLSGKENSVNADTFGTKRFYGHDLVEDSLNMRQTVAYDKDEFGKLTKNPQETLAAQAGQEKLQQEFQKFMRSSIGDAEKDNLQQLYNERFNSYVERKFIGPNWDYYPGASVVKKLRPHQKAVVSRILAGSTGVFHSVGTGKTLVGITALMEARRLGLSRKSIFVAQNATVSQIAATAKETYPMAKILAPGEGERSAENRQRLLSRIATGNWDIVILPQSFVSLIPDDPKRVIEEIEEQLRNLREAKSKAEHGDGRHAPSVKTIVKAIAALEKKLKEQASRPTDNVIKWDQLGVDMLVVDEAHAYKKLGFTTAMSNIRGIDTGRSERAFSMYMKVRAIQEKHAGKNVVFMTGTPVTNTMAELWTMLKFLRPDLLKEYGITEFDAFASTFGEIVPGFEYTSTAQWKVISRFAKFQNGPELIKLLRTAADVVLSEDVKIPGVPKVKGGKPEQIKIQRSQELEAFINRLRDALKEWENLPGAEKMKLRHIPLLIYNQAKQAAIDLRLINPNYPDNPEGKVNQAVRRIKGLYAQYDDQKATQLVFSDLFQSPPQEDKYLDEDHTIPNPAYGKGKRFNLYDDLKGKLIAAGIPKDEIFVMRDANSDAARMRVFSLVNSGKIRVLIGSTGNMGMGVNVNERLIALHHLDAPPRPMDLEQRNGRIIRQGNIFQEVNILVYGVEQTLDATAFQRLVIKQRFINQVMRGNLTSRTFEDPADEVQMSLQEIMADLTGDPLALQRHAEETKIRQLEMLREAHFSKLRNIGQEIDHLRRVTVPYEEERLQKLRTTISEVNREFPEAKIRDVEIGGTKISGAKVPEALTTFFTNEFAKAKAEYLKLQDALSRTLGMTADMPNIKLGPFVLSSRVETRVNMADGIDEQNAGWQIFRGLGKAEEQPLAGGHFQSPSGFNQSFSSVLRYMPTLEEDTIKKIADYKQQMHDKGLMLNDPFPQESELELHKKRLAEIEAELEAKTKTPDKGKPGEPEAGKPEEGPEEDIEPSLLGTPGVQRVKRSVQAAMPPALQSFVSAKALPQAREALAPFVQAKNWILGTFAPTVMGQGASEGARDLRYHLGDLARRREVAFELFRKAKHHFGRLSPEHNLDFIDAVETGKTLSDPTEQQAAELLRRLLDQRRDIIWQRKGLEHYILNYFPHMWKDPVKAEEAIGRYLAKRPLEGSKEFLKKRTIMTTREGIALGLKPISDNPIDMVLARIYDMDRMIMAGDLREDWEKHGLWKFYAVGQRIPDGWRKLDDKFGTVFGNPNIPVKEYVDAIKYDKILEVMQNFGVPFAREMKIGGGKLGFYAENPLQGPSSGYIKTRFGTPLGVMVHELGHYLDSKYRLGDQFVNNKYMREELRKLADLRYEGQNVTQHFKNYVRRQEEKMANMIDAFVNIPDQMRKIAPNTWAMLNRLIDRYPELKPLREIRPSLTMKELESSVSAGGLVIHGNYYLPEGAANVINNYLSPGLRGNVFFESWRGIGNVLNQLQLIGGFHLAFTSIDAMTSDVALSLEHFFAGHPLQAIKKFAEFPIAPLVTYTKGNRIIRDYLRENPEDAKMVEGIVLAGGRIRMDKFYFQSSVEKFWDAIRAGKVGSAVWNAPIAAIEAAAWPIMSHLVPRMKLGVFVDLAQKIFDDAHAGNWPRERLTAELQKAWDSVDNRMGQLVYDNLFWRRGVKDLGLASVRSLGWNLGTFRELGGGIGDVFGQAGRAARGKRPQFTHRMAYVVALPFVAGLIGAVLYYLYNGKAPETLKDYFFPKTGRKNSDGSDQRVSLPTYMKDVYAYMERPLTTLEDKVHPLITMVGEMLSNHDFYHTEIRNPDDPMIKQGEQIVRYMVNQYKPFALRGFEDWVQAGAGSPQAGQSLIGLNPAPRYIDQEPWEKKMYDSLRRRGQQFSTREKAEVRDFRSEFVSRMKMGRLKPDDIVQAKKLGLLSPGGAPTDERLLEMMTLTPDEIAFKRLSFQEALEVYKMMPKLVQAQYQRFLTEKLANTQDFDKLLPALVGAGEGAQ